MTKQDPKKKEFFEELKKFNSPMVHIHSLRHYTANKTQIKAVIMEESSYDPPLSLCSTLDLRVVSYHDEHSLELSVSDIAEQLRIKYKKWLQEYKRKINKPQK